MRSQGINSANRIAVVIPSYKVRDKILPVLESIGPEVGRIYVVDDCCPLQSGKFVETHCTDPRVKVLFHPVNKGVGGATVSGFRAALADGAEVVVKLDGDGQMNPAEIPRIVSPLLLHRADYVKGNRFYSLENLEGMPAIRLFGNSVLSFVTKVSSGYWNIMDPTNGYVAVHRAALEMIPLEKLDERYFFESDMLFRLNIARAVVKEIPLRAIYGDEESNLSIAATAWKFPAKHLNRFFKRLAYTYFLRNFNACSLQIVCGLLLLAFGISFGLYHWIVSVSTGMPATTGTVMLAAVPAILGFQLLLAALLFDVTNVPKEPLSAEDFDFAGIISSNDQPPERTIVNS